MMERLLAKIFPLRDSSSIAYTKAMTKSGALLDRMREAASSGDPARAVMADLWQQRHNVPFMVTVLETVEEMKSGLKQRPEDL